MSLNKKISLSIIVVVFTSLLASSVINLLFFHSGYSEALLSGSLDLAKNINAMVGESLKQGLSLRNLSGMNKRLSQIVELNPHIEYAEIVDLQGVAVYHSNPDQIGTQRMDDHRYDEVSVPILDTQQQPLGAINLGFHAKVLKAKLQHVLIQQCINFLMAFLIIALGLKKLLSQLVSQPLRALSRYAKHLTAGDFQAKASCYGSREFRDLSVALQQFAITVDRQIQTSQQTRHELEALVSLRTEELARVNQKLIAHNAILKQTVTSLRISERALSESEAKFRHLFESSSDTVLLLTPEEILDCNQAALTLFGCSDSKQLCGKHPADLSPLTQANGINSHTLADQLIDKTLTQGPQLFEWTHVRVDNNQPFICETMLTSVVLQGEAVLLAQIRDISARKHEEKRERQRQDVLERLIRGEKLSCILESIVRIVEQEHPGVLCSILLLDEISKRWLIGAAPNLPQHYQTLINGIEIGPDDAFSLLGQRQIIEDIHHHPEWAQCIDTDADWHFNACWLEPILGLQNKLLGNLMLYHPQSASPSAADLEWMQRIAHECAIVIERSRTASQQQLAATVFDNSYEGIMITDANDCIIDVNPAYSRITGYQRTEVLGLSPAMLQSERTSPECQAKMQQALKQEGFWRGEIWNQRKNGETFPQMLAIAAVPDEEGQVKNYVSVFSDISLLKAHEEELNRIANYDSLTGLPNRRLLRDRLKQAMAQAQRHGKLLAVCYLDLDGFKPINDCYGHETGDRLLVILSQRLQSNLRGNDTLARLGGDEFVLLIGELNAAEECDYALSRTLQELSQPYDLGDAVVTVSASIGVTLYPLDDADGDTLLRQADHAMYRAKQLGKNRYQLFDPQRDRDLKNRRDQVQAMLSALHNDEFVLYYQPKVNLMNGTLIGVEALIRWQHPQRGLLTPAQFIDLFNGSELESELGHWVLDRTLRQIAEWQQRDLSLKVSVNISALHLLSPNFVESLQDLLSAHPGLNPKQLELEVLETAAMDDMQRAVDVMNRCKALGVYFALDDFGTGYSSLAYFRRLPVDMLKIDQGFVRDMLVDQEDFTIVESVVQLAQAFNRPVIAEGVETLEHAAKLIQLGCILGQGYGIARPMPANDLDDWSRNWQQQAAWRTFEHPSLPIKDLPLAVAAQNHKCWIEQLQHYLQAPDQYQLPPLSSHQCSFGHWCQGSGRLHYGDWREFQDIDLIHERIHQLAAEAVETLNLGDQSSLPELQAELNELREQLLSLLQTLSKKVTNLHSGATDDPMTQSTSPLA